MDKKDQIINAARNLFKKYGYKKVSMMEIANEANVTKKTIYSYFKDKDSLFEYFVIEELKRMKEIVNQNENSEDYVKNFHNIVYNLIKYKKSSEFLNIIEREATVLKTTASIKFIEKVNNYIIDFIKEKLQEKINAGIIIECDIDLCSYLIYTMYISVMFNYKSDKLNEQEISDNLVYILKNGILK